MDELSLQSDMSDDHERFIWSDMLRLELIKEVEKRETIWKSNSFNGMDDKMAREITKSLLAVATGFCPLTAEHVKNEWKAISDECVRVLSVEHQILEHEASIWRFGSVLRFMLYAVTQTNEGNAYAMIYVFESKSFYVISEELITGVLWPNARIKARLNEKLEDAVILAIGMLTVMGRKIMQMTRDEIPSGVLEQQQPTIRHTSFRNRSMDKEDCLLREDDGTVYYNDDDKKMISLEESSVTPSSSLPASPGENPASSESSSYYIPPSIRGFGLLFPESSYDDNEIKEERELFRKQPMLIDGYCGPSHWYRALAAFIKKHLVNDSAFPVHVIPRIPTRISKRMENSVTDFRRVIFQEIANSIQTCEEMKRFVADVKIYLDRRIKLIIDSLNILGRRSSIPLSLPDIEILAYIMVIQQRSLKQDIFQETFYKYCRRPLVLKAAVLHPTKFVRFIAELIFKPEQLALLFSEKADDDQIERFRWLKSMVLSHYEEENPLTLWRKCLQALSALADFENLMLKLRNDEHLANYSGRGDIAADQDDDSSGSGQRDEESQRNYLLPQTLLRVACQCKTAEKFAVKIATIIYWDSADAVRPCAQKEDQAKLNWLKKQVLELFPMYTEKGNEFQWNHCVDALDVSAREMRKRYPGIYNSDTEPED